MPEGISIDILKAAESLAASIALRAAPFISRFKPVPNMASTIMSKSENA